MQKGKRRIKQGLLAQLNLPYTIYLFILNEKRQENLIDGPNFHELKVHTVFLILLNSIEWFCER